MNIFRRGRLIASVVAVTTALVSAGCNGQSDQQDPLVANSPATDASSEQNLPQEPITNEMSDEMLGSEETLADDGRVDTETSDPETSESEPFDIAEYFFTEVDRQWFCSVTTSVSVFTDQLYVDRQGSAWFERFGQAEWSRANAVDQLDIVTLLAEEFSLREIFATNTLLEFQRYNNGTVDGSTAVSELYECVLITRYTGNL